MRLRLRTISHLLLMTLAAWLAYHGSPIDGSLLLGVALTGEADGLLADRGAHRREARSGRHSSEGTTPPALTRRAASSWDLLRRTF